MRRVLMLLIWCLITINVWSSDVVEIKTVLFPFKEAIISGSVSSSIVKYEFKIGENFSQDRVIVTLNNDFYDFEYRRALEQYKFAQNNYEDKKALFERKFVSDIELKRAFFDMSMATIQRDEAKLNLDYCTLKAPFAGKIVEVLTQEHEVVRAGQPLFKIIDDSRLFAVINAPANMRNLTKIGGVIQIKIDNGAIVKGEIYEVSPQVDHRTGTQRVRILIDNKSGLLTAGMTGALHYGE